MNSVTLDRSGQSKQTCFIHTLTALHCPLNRKYKRPGIKDRQREHYQIVQLHKCNQFNSHKRSSQVKFISNVLLQSEVLLTQVHRKVLQLSVCLCAGVREVTERGVTKDCKLLNKQFPLRVSAPRCSQTFKCFITFECVNYLYIY